MGIIMRVPQHSTYSIFHGNKGLRLARINTWLASQRIKLRYRPAERNFNELIYRSLFSKDLARFKIEDRFYPSPTDHSLLYILVRFLGEKLRDRGDDIRVLDVGSGISSMILGDFSRLYQQIKPLTLEHDPDWANRIGELVPHEVRFCPLVSIKLPNGTFGKFYDLSALNGKFDLIIVDGPLGTRRYSRFGAVRLFEEFLADQFAFIADDAHRRGELDTVNYLVSQSFSKKSVSGYRFIHGRKSQFIAFSSANISLTGRSPLRALRLCQAAARRVGHGFVSE
jgi:hypothetical protein